MPPRKSSTKKGKKSKKSNKSNKSRSEKRRTPERVVYVPVVHYRHHLPKSPLYRRRPHHYSYTRRPHHSDYNEHVNRVNYADTPDLSHQDLVQRQLKANPESYVPNFMHVSSSELAIPPPYRKQNGMRAFANF